MKTVVQVRKVGFSFGSGLIAIVKLHSPIRHDRSSFVYIQM